MVVIGAIFFYLAPSVAWFAFLPIPFILWGSFHFQHRLAPRYMAVRERVGLLNAVLSNNLTGIATIKSYTSEPHEVAHVDVVSEEYRAANRAAIKYSSAFSPLIRMVIVVGFVTSWVRTGHPARSGVGSHRVARVPVHHTHPVG